MLIAAVVVHNSQVIKESEEEAVKEQGPYA